MPTTTLTRDSGRTVMWCALVSLLAVLAVFATIRVVQDTGNIGDPSSLADDAFEKRYAEHPVIAYAHIVPGIVFLSLVPFQLSRRFRRGALPRHRTLGRIAASAALISAVFAIVFGVAYPYGGGAESSASVVFAGYLVVAVVLAVRAARAHDVITHRRWMIRAVSVGIAVGTIRLWLGLFEGLGVWSFENAFGPVFWLSFVMHAIAAELYLLARPRPGARTAMNS